MTASMSKFGPCLLGMTFHVLIIVFDNLLHLSIESDCLFLVTCPALHGVHSVTSIPGFGLDQKLMAHSLQLSSLRKEPAIHSEMNILATINVYKRL